MKSGAVSPWREATAAARANLVPGLVLQAFAVGLVLAYYFHAPTHAALEALAAVKTRWGYAYSAVATALCGGIIPFLYLRSNPRTRGFNPWSHFPFHLGFWAYRGMEVDLFYRCQGLLFGNEASVAVIAKKVVVDLLGYTVLWAMPTAILLFLWKDSGYDFARMRRLDAIGFLQANLPKAILGAWVVWLPAVIVIYSLPAPLQVPLFNIVLCFYALLFASLNGRNRDPRDA